jgi:hypothetical protein
MTSAQYQTLLARLDRMDRRIDESAAETRRYVDESVQRSGEETRQYVDRLVHGSTEETRRHFDVVAEGLRGEVRLLAELVSANDSLLSERIETVRQAAAAEGAETRALLKLSYGQLDRRVTALERRMGPE